MLKKLLSNFVTEDWKQTPLPVNDLDYTQHILGVYAGYVLKVKKWNAFVSISIAYVTAHDVFYPALDLMHIGQGVEIVYLYGLFGSVSFVFTFFDVAF